MDPTDRQPRRLRVGLKPQSSRYGRPTFYVRQARVTSEGRLLWSYTGPAPGGIWQRLDTNDGLTGGFGIFAVDPGDPDDLCL